MTIAAPRRHKDLNPRAVQQPSGSHRPGRYRFGTPTFCERKKTALPGIPPSWIRLRPRLLLGLPRSSGSRLIMASARAPRDAPMDVNW
jgi:hypothetical protein